MASKRGSSLKGNNLLQNPFLLEKPHFQKWIIYKKPYRKSLRFVLLAKNRGKSTKRISSKPLPMSKLYGKNVMIRTPMTRLPWLIRTCISVTRKYFRWLSIHCSLETTKRVIGKQCRPRSDATERGVWSGSPLFANSSTIFLEEYLTYLKSTLESSDIQGR